MSTFPTFKATPEGKRQTLERRTARVLKASPSRITKAGHIANPTTPPTPNV